MDKNRLFQLELKCKQYQKTRKKDFSSYFDMTRNKLSFLKIDLLIEMFSKIKNIEFSGEKIVSTLKKRVVYIPLILVLLTLSGYLVYKYTDLELPKIETPKFIKDFDFRDYIPHKWIFWEKGEIKKTQNSDELNLSEENISEEELVIDFTPIDREIVENKIKDIIEIEKEIDFDQYVLLDYREYRDDEKKSEKEIVDEFEDAPDEEIVYVLELPRDDRVVIDDWGRYYEREDKGMKEKEEITLSSTPEFEIDKNQTIFEHLSENEISEEIEDKEFEVPIFSCPDGIEIVENIDLCKFEFENSSESEIAEKESEEVQLNFTEDKLPDFNESREIVEKDISKPSVSNIDDWDGFYIFNENVDDNQTIEESLKKEAEIVIDKNEKPEITIQRIEQKPIVIDNEDSRDELPLDPLEEAISSNINIPSIKPKRVEESSDKKENKSQKGVKGDWSDFQLFTAIEKRPIISPPSDFIVSKSSVNSTVETQKIELPSIEIQKVQSETNETSQKDEINISEKWNMFQLFKPREKIGFKDSNISKEFENIDPISGESVSVNKKEKSSISQKPQDKNSSLENNISREEKNLEKQKDIPLEANITQESRGSFEKDITKKESGEVSKDIPVEEIKKVEPKIEKVEEEPKRREKPNSSISPAEVVDMKIGGSRLETEEENRYNTIFLKPTVNFRELRE